MRADVLGHLAQRFFAFLAVNFSNAAESACQNFANKAQCCRCVVQLKQVCTDLENLSLDSSTNENQILFIHYIRAYPCPSFFVL